MIELQCPRCKQHWGRDREEGCIRLCQRCGDGRWGRRAGVDLPLLVGVGLFLELDLMLIALAALMPAVFGKVLLGFAVVMLVAGWAICRFLHWERGRAGWRFPPAGNIDWRTGRWALLSLLSGFVCLLAYGSFLGLTR
jgi:hypothetical protein